MSDKHKHKVTKDPLTGVETTGHVWDDTLQEFNNPLPGWWLWAFYATIIFSIVYWVIYPSWPTGFAERGFLSGTSEVVFKDKKGNDVTASWSTRAILAREMQTDPNELRRQEMVRAVAATPLADVLKDDDKKSFVLAYGKGIFGDYCAGCHQQGGGGIIGSYPNLLDDAWLWGAESTDIETSIRKGRKGNMPAHAQTLSSEEITQAAHYVLTLSGEPADTGLAEKGKIIYNTKGCSGCHMPTGVGMKAPIGSANLTDKIWTQANVLAAKGSAAKVKVVSEVISKGIQREMPAWESRLSDDEIKVLVAYIKIKSANLTSAINK